MTKRNPVPIGITQGELERFQELEADLSEIAIQYAELKADFIAKVKAGAPIQEGRLTIEVTESPRKSPAWKEAFIKTNGDEAAQAVIEATEETKVTTVDVHRRSRFAR